MTLHIPAKSVNTCVVIILFIIHWKTVMSYDNWLYMYYEIVLCLHRYTSDELKYFPLNTAMLDPPKDLIPGTQDLLAAGNQEKEVPNGDMILWSLRGNLDQCEVSSFSK